MSTQLDVSLTYYGSDADEHFIDFYDAAEALIGFQRSLALTTHLVINGQIITQAPALKGARILTYPTAPGSWKTTAVILVGAYHVLMAPKDTVLGNMVRSAYDYVISQTVGVHVDFDKTVGQQYDELRKSQPSIPKPKEDQFDALLEKVEAPIRQMHRPIIVSETAKSALLTSASDEKVKRLGVRLNPKTYDFVNYTERGNFATPVNGRVSSFNLNTFKGRLFSFDEGRPVPFILSENIRTLDNIGKITRSLNANGQSKMRGAGDLKTMALVDKSRAEVVKRYIVVSVDEA